MSGGGAAQFECPKIEGFTFAIDPNGICVGSQDWASVFTQAGRVDFITLLLAAIGLGLALLAFPAYKVVRMEADKTARLAVEDIRAEVSALAERIAFEEVQRQLPGIVEAYIDVSRGVSADEANEIAMAQEDGRDE